MQVSEIGFGTWGLGGDVYGPVEDTQSVSALRHAFDKGINFYDTAAFYGAGHAESILHQAFGRDRENVIITSKVELLSDFKHEASADAARDHILAELDNSLSRLKTDYLDVYLMHSPDLSNGDAIDHAAAVLKNLKKGGKIRAWGISTRTPNDALSAIKRWQAEVIEVNFNVIDQRCREIGLFDLVQAANVGFICRTPLCFGYLTGTLTGSTDELGPLDHRANWSQGQLDTWARSPNLFAEFYEGKERTATQFAIQFCLAEKSISTVIPGMLTCDQVAENAGAVDVPQLTPAGIAIVEKIYGQNSFYDAGAKPKHSGLHKGTVKC